MDVKIHIASIKFKILDHTLYPGYKFRGLRGGRGGAKSHSIARVLIRNAMKYRMFVVCAREIQISLKESAYKLIRDTIISLGLFNCFKFVENEIRCHSTGTRFIFIGLKANPDSIKSLESAHIVWLEEANKVSMNSWDILIPTMRAKGWEIWASWNPDLPTDPVEIVFEREKHRAIVANVSYLDNPDLDRSKVLEAEQMKADDPEKYEHVYLGAYRPMGDDAVISLRTIVSATERVPIDEGGPLIAALDVAYYGSDDSILSFRKDNRLFPQESKHGIDTMQLERWTADRVLTLGASILIVDAGGSPGVAEHIQEILGPMIPVVKFNGSHASSTPEYANARAENWFRLETWMRTKGTIPKDRELMDQLMVQKYKYNSNNRRQLDSKEHMRSIGIGSPDKGDSVSMTFARAVEHAAQPMLDLSRYKRK